MAAPFDVLAAAVVPWTGRPSTVRHRFSPPILFCRTPGWKSKSHERTPGAGLLGAHGLIRGPVGQLGRGRAPGPAAGAGGAQPAVRDGRDGELAGEQAGRPPAQLALE